MSAIVRGSLLVLVLLVSAGPARAQQEAPPEGELRQAMREYFRNQLRMELALSDEQMERLLPKIEQIELARTEARRERRRVMQQLRQGLRGGADDAALQAVLDELDRIEVRQGERERELIAEVDAMLTVRQRVQFRFFTQRFRQELQRRIQQLRRERIGEPGGFGERPLGESP